MRYSSSWWRGPEWAGPEPCHTTQHGVRLSRRVLTPLVAGERNREEWSGDEVCCLGTPACTEVT